MLLEKKHTHSSFRPLLVLTLLIVVIGAQSTAHADVVTDWNQIALNMASAINPQFAPQTRVLSQESF
jgi:hypothetical protein